SIGRELMNETTHIRDPPIRKGKHDGTFLLVLALIIAAQTSSIHKIYGPAGFSLHLEKILTL
ncbi:MAG: hypothetical protein AAGD28_31205, partial [Bacteroidota bacterium]